MDKSTKGAWLLAQSKCLDAVTGAGAASLENITFAGRVGRLYNLLRRNIPGVPNPTIDAETVTRICQLNNIDRPTREVGLKELKREGRIDVSDSGAVSVLGVTSQAVLELTADIFDRVSPTLNEQAVLSLSDTVAQQPVVRTEAIDAIGDTYGITKITLPDALLKALIDGRDVGGRRGVRAIGEDYRELERRQVVKVMPRGNSRFVFRLLKRDVGELARTIIRGDPVAQEALLLDGSPATDFKGPHEVRTAVRNRNSVNDRQFVADAFERLRSGG